METSIPIKESMSLGIITKSPKTSVEEVAKEMAGNDIGSVIISENGNNEGIVTERDICYKVVAKGKDPKTVLAKDIMSTNLVTISSEKTLTEAAKLMVKKGIRRLAVKDKGQISGIITASDILAVSPKTIEILTELYQIYSNPEEVLAEAPDELSEGGTCDECATFTDNLSKVDGRFLCDDCKEELEA